MEKFFLTCKLPFHFAFGSELELIPLVFNLYRYYIVSDCLFAALGIADGQSMFESRLFASSPL